MTSERAVDRFRELLRIPTVSRLDEALTEWDVFDRFIERLESLYPLVHASLTRERVAGYSLLFHWAGERTDDPLVLMAHYDVVAATDEGWEHPPFAAEVTGAGTDREIWGRGTLDDKGSLVAILESVEELLTHGYRPARDVYLAFGHDEEVAGIGAPAIVELLAERGVRPGLVLDEGGAVALNAFPGVSRPIAVVGVSEKGASLFRLVVETPGGHASTPPLLSTTARLARAIVRLNSRPFPSAMPSPLRGMIAAIAPHTAGATGRVLRAMPITSPLLLRILRRSDETRAMIQTTQAVTLLEAGHASNALPERAEAMVNVRVAVGSSVAEALDHVRRAINDPIVEIEIVAAGEPSPVSPTSGEAWEAIRAVVASRYPEAILAPYAQTGATDSRHFTRITPNVYRFSPFVVTREERNALHARNERLHVASFLDGIEFYRELIERW